jgi:DNA-directed RNA polymerase subunit K/omega
MSTPFFKELYKNKDSNYYEVVNVAAQAARLVNEQANLKVTKLKHKATTEALIKVLDGRIVKLEKEKK